MRHKLYLQIYFSFIGGLLLFALLAGFTWHTLSGESEPAKIKAGMSLLLAEALPTEQPAAELQQRLKKLGATINVQLSLYSRDGEHLSSSAAPLPLPKARLEQGRDHEWDQAAGNFTLRLADGRWLVVSHQGNHFPSPLIAILLLLGVLGLAAKPVARRLTCRLEQLQKQVDAFGHGDLTARAKVRGVDEIATLATRFNHAAERIEKLIEGQKHILSGASHELRSPLTRMRMAIELMQPESLAETKHKLEADIAELDDLVEELLMASRLDAGSSVKPFEPIDLLALAAEAGAPYAAEISGEAISVMGDETMLRRLLRNLLENGSRHAVTAPVSLHVSCNGKDVLIRVCDDGPGIPAGEQEKVFEPFYQGHSDQQAHGSIGLGLSLVRKIAHQHHGEVRYVENDTHGACFEVRLPMA